MSQAAVTLSITAAQAEILIEAIACVLDRTTDETAHKRLVGIQLQCNDGLRKLRKISK